MDIRLLGPIEASLDNGPAPLGARQQRAVLAMLALEPNRTVSTDRLIEGVWGERAPRSAPKLVQLYVSRLRRVFGEEAEIVTRGRGYELRVPIDCVDAARFERLVAGAAGNGGPAAALAREALALWRGPPLADVADEPFAAMEIRRLEELRLRALELAIDGDLAAGRHRELIPELDTLVLAHPLAERLHAQRMLALYRSSRQVDALAAYRHARRVLVEAAGVEPSLELRRLHDTILRQDAAAFDLPARAHASPEAVPQAPPRPVRRRWPIAVASLVLVGALAAAVFGHVTARNRSARIAENAVGLIDPGSGRLTRQYAVGHDPGAMATGAGSLWVANTLDGTVSRIDPRRPEVVTIDVGGEPTGLAFAAGALWVANGESRTVAQVDPGTNRVVGRIPVGNQSRAIAAGYGALWVVSAVDGAVRRVALGRPGRSHSIAVGADPTAIVAGAGGIWAASEEAGTVTRLDPRTGAVIRAIHVGNGPAAVAVGAHAVWAVNRPDGTVMRIDPATNTVDATIRVGDDPAAIAVSGDAGWVAGGQAGTVTRIDPRTPRVLSRLTVNSSIATVASGEGRVWAAAVAPAAGHRGGTLRVDVPEGEVPSDWLSLAIADATSQITSLAYDGLVGYRRVDGAAGATIVAGLAADVPAPSRDGRTYVFTLRPGLRYSDGTPVRPQDFRGSLERFMRRTHGYGLTPFYDVIVGAHECRRRPARCDLSAGIQTDPRARTITVHLTRPDAEFLHKLTLPYAYVVPASTPERPADDRPPPGTGPYRIAAWDAYRGGALVRNPYFRSPAPQARPAGYADRIEVKVAPPSDAAAQARDVQRGAADLVLLANAFTALVSPARLDAIAAGSAGRLYRRPEAILDSMFLNVLRPPFADVRARRALNYATDRARVVELEGGQGLASATCQILPVGFPGYDGYCPYTERPGPGRAWTAPDMDRARALVKASGTAGERVVVFVPDFKRALGRYFAGLLHRLGYRASLRVLGDRYFPVIQDRRTRAQIGFSGYSADYAAPSSFIQTNFTCSSQAERPALNPSYFCNRPLARQVDLALATQGADAAQRWATIDHRLTDLAPAVPLTNRRSTLLVSRRVGNVQHPLQGYALLDQMWVR